MDPSVFSEFVTWVNNLKPCDIGDLPHEGESMTFWTIDKGITIRNCIFWGQKEREGSQGGEFKQNQ